MTDSLVQFIDFLYESNQMETRMFQLNPIFYPDGSKVEIEPIGEYFIYQQHSYDFKWWSYNLQQLREIVDHQGGMITDKNHKLMYIKYP